MLAYDKIAQYQTAMFTVVFCMNMKYIEPITILNTHDQNDALSYIPTILLYISRQSRNMPLKSSLYKELTFHHHIGFSVSLYLE